MSVGVLDHFNIRTRDLKATVRDPNGVMLELNYEAAREKA
jgi:hypothetical protein